MGKEMIGFEELIVICIHIVSTNQTIRYIFEPIAEVFEMILFLRFFFFYWKDKFRWNAIISLKDGLTKHNQNSFNIRIDFFNDCY
jgi:hypothetical protein